MLALRLVMYPHYAGSSVPDIWGKYLPFDVTNPYFQSTLGLFFVGQVSERLIQARAGTFNARKDRMPAMAGTLRNLSLRRENLLGR